VVRLGSHDKGRAHTGGMGIGRNPKHVPTPEEIIQKLKMTEVIMSRGSGTNVKIELEMNQHGS
jgi:hypothetical protein